MRKLLFSLLLLVYTLPGLGQTGQRDQNSPPTILDELRASMSSLDPSRISTGVLADQVVPFTNPHRFAGQGDTINSYSNWLQQYWEFYNAKLDPSNLPTVQTMEARIQAKLDAGQVPLLAIHYRYNELVPDAAALQLIQIDSVNAKVYDGTNRSQSPYQERTLFAVALPIKNVAGPTTVYVGPEFWAGNISIPAALSIDFGDGAGYRSVPMGSTVQVNWPAATTQSTASRQASVATPIVNVYNAQTNMSAQTATKQLRLASIRPNLGLGIWASRIWPNTPQSSAIAWVKWGANNQSGKFRKPLVFVEGIDFAKRNGGDDDKSNPLNYYNYWVNEPSQPGIYPLPLNSAYFRGGVFRNGEAGWNEMVDYNTDYKNLEKMPILRDQLQSAGSDYDIVYLDFTDGATYIQSNAMTLVDLLAYINDPAHHEGNTETVVMGASMGGQVARFALAWMEQQGLCHNAKMYVSMDSPHRGANIPLGIQHLIDKTTGLFTGGFDDQRDKLMRPASQQMLIYHFDANASTLRNEWQAWQSSPGSYPSLLRKVAIANGSRQGINQPGMWSGMELLRTSKVSPWWGENYAYALPGETYKDKNNIVLRFKHVSFLPKWEYVQVPGNTPAYDTAPGGTYRTAGLANDEHPGVFKMGFASNTFMPTISTLDVFAAGSIGSPNLDYNIRDNIDPSRPDRSKYAFDAYFAPDIQNEPHVQITDRNPSLNNNPIYSTDNIAWIQNELRESEHQLQPVLTNVYNFGSAYRRLLPSVQVNDGGDLNVNNGNLPVSGGTSATHGLPVEASFEMYTSNCGTVVQVNQGGRFTLGMMSGAKQASVAFATRSLLDLRAGSQTAVYQGSVLRIQRGATLLVRSGASLQVEGKLIIEAGAYLCLDPGANLKFSSGSELYVDPSSFPGANPVLGISGLNCTGQVASCGQVNSGNGITNTPPTKNEALLFDGDDDLVTIPRTNTYLSEFAPSNLEFTIEALVRVDRRTNHSQTIFSNRRGLEGQTPHEQGMLFSLYGPTLFVQLQGMNYGITDPKNNVPDDGHMHHVAVTRNRDGNIAFFIDGVPTGVIDYSTKSAYSAGNAFIGGEFPRVNGYAESFAGLIGEVRVWNAGRSAADIRNNMSTRLSAPQNGLVAYYDMQDAAGSQTVSDWSAVTSSGRQLSPGYLGETGNGEYDDPAWKTVCEINGGVYGNLRVASRGTEDPIIMLPDTLGQSTTHYSKTGTKNKYVEALSIAPNPASNNAVLHFEQKLAGPISVRVLDMMGVEQAAVLRGKKLQAGAQQVPLGFKTLKPGVYMVVVETPAGQERTRLQVE